MINDSCTMCLSSFLCVYGSTVPCFNSILSLSFFFHFSRPCFKIFISGFAVAAAADLSNSGNDCVN